jgi:GT2 family glycosyltransferase
MKKKIPPKESDLVSEETFYSMSLPRVLIVIVNWNGKDVLQECLASIRKLTYPRDSYHVLVIDNASSDGSQQLVSQQYPDCGLFENSKNIGYVKAVNQGIEYGLRSGTDYIWVFNNDVIVEKDSLGKLVEVGQQDEKIGVIAPVIYGDSNYSEINNTGYAISFWTGRLRKLKYGGDIFKNQEGKTADVDSILGCSNLIKATVFRKVGLLRPAYELYFEETDFNVRARQKGFRVVVVKEAKVVHRNAATMNRFILRRAYLFLKNLFLFELFNAKPKHLLVFIPYYFLIHIPYFLIRGGLYGIRVKWAQLAK